MAVRIEERKADKKYFAMADQEGRDTRGQNDQHAVRVISLDNKNDVRHSPFMAHMTRGSHEGEVGVGPLLL